MKGKKTMKAIKRALLALCALTVVTLAVPHPAAVAASPFSIAVSKVKNGWSGNYYYQNGKKVTGLKKISGKYYYFNSKGVLQKNKAAYKIVVSGKTRYYNINAKGIATRLKGTKELAAIRLNKLGASLNSITPAKQLAALKKAFLWSAQISYRAMSTSVSAAEAPDYFGSYGFKTGRGDCQVQAYTFYWMAKVLGYKPAFVKGYVPRSKTSDGKYSNFASHAWCTISIDGVKYVFDPNFNTSSDAAALRAANKYVGFMFRYGDKNTYAYHNLKKKLLTA